MEYHQTIEALCGWFTKQLTRLDEAPTLHQCELLLCARELGADSPRIRGAIDRLIEEEKVSDPKQGRLIDAVMRQLVFIRFGVAEEERRRFLKFWFHERNFRGQDILMVSFLVAVALEQQDFLESSNRQYVRNWHLKHRRLRADRVRAWVPYHLMQAGHTEAAASRAEAVLLSRNRNGSWSDDLRRTVACAYPLVLSGLVPPTALEDSLRYILERLSKGLIEEITLQAQALKLLALAGVIPKDLVDLISLRLRNDGSIFLSYNQVDREFVRRLAGDLKAHGIRIWVDEGEILPGDSLLEKIEHGIEDMQYLGVVLSNSSVRSAWVRTELRMAQAIQLAEREIRVLPILVEDCRIPLSLRDVCWADFRTRYEDGLSRLLRRLAPWTLGEAMAHNTADRADGNRRQRGSRRSSA